MLPKHRIPTHPGEILLEEFLKPMGVTQVAFAQHIGVSVQRVNELVRGKRGITPDTAWLLSECRPGHTFHNFPNVFEHPIWTRCDLLLM